jgi:SAM-dependent methyltransferase
MRDNLRAIFETLTLAGKDGKNPRSGPHSDMETTAPLRAALPGIFKRFKVKTFVDAGCGDWFWMQHVSLKGVKYIGCDISKDLLDEVSKKFSKTGVRFMHLDITSDPLPDSDMLMCRDCLVHLKLWLKWKFFENFAASKTKYLLMTFHTVQENVPVRVNSGFKPFNPMIAPFNFPAPLEIIPETSATPDDSGLRAEAANDHRSLGVWSHAQIVEVLAQRQAALDDASPTSDA